MLFLVTWGLVVSLSPLVPGPVMAQVEDVATPAPAADPGNEIDGFPVRLDNTTLFRVRADVSGVTAAERANIISQRILAIAQDSAISPDSIRVSVEGKQHIVLAGDTVLFTIRPEDERAYGMPREELAATAVERIQQGIITYRERRSLRRLFTSIVTTVLSTVAVFLFLRGLLFATSKMLTNIQRRREAGTLSVRFKGIELLGPGATNYLVSGLIRLVRLGLILLALYLYVPFVLSQFPATEVLGESVLQKIASRAHQLVEGFVAYLPKLVMLAILALITYYVIEFARQVIIELGRHDVYPWFYPEWVQPTIRLVSLLIVAIALVIASPFLPGFGSPAFQGVSLFIGALLTLGSSSAVANALSGIILIYTRAFQLGDFIRIDNIIGEVLEKSLFVTRVLTPKQETVTIPNTSVLSSNVTNFSAICRESQGFLVLYTTVTLGYDVPWRKIHQVLIEAANITADIEPDPPPFVLQTNLNDFNVSYELNAYTVSPARMPVIYSKLHQNIQDKCNEAGIEILSPAFSALRDGNHSTIPADYLPPDYASPGFVVQGANHQSPRADG
ncbi:MAG: mechanosensitive ion channel family protein [Leptolyngbyaceae cyanobacterium SM2_5_2]|nr:mechanosensitive ion channel family protein [Leptolyngbyaceae cyanobacterium SM2_5_2]